MALRRTSVDDGLEHAASLGLLLSACHWRSPHARDSLLQLLVGKRFRLPVFAVHQSDILERDFLRAIRLTYAVDGAVAESLDVQLIDHLNDALSAFDLSLRQPGE